MPTPFLANSTSVVFGLETPNYYPYELDEAEDIITPGLDIYRCAADAAAHRDGIDIWETLAGFGDLWFFAADGSPLEARFSREPYFNADKPTYFPGVYTLEPGTGEDLLSAIAKVIAKNGNSSLFTRIIVGTAACDEAARQYGWSSVQAMKDGVELALRILPPDLLTRVMFTRVPYNGEFFSHIEDALR
ncbi:MAG: hypothetical protein WBQ76_15785 [Candidatus Korobacteraceae bacterium]